MQTAAGTACEVTSQRDHSHSEIVLVQNMKSIWLSRIAAASRKPLHIRLGGSEETETQGPSRLADDHFSLDTQPNKRPVRKEKR